MKASAGNPQTVAGEGATTPLLHTLGFCLFPLVATIALRYLQHRQTLNTRSWQK